jgi:MATE family multidrug resistance protein
VFGEELIAVFNADPRVVGVGRKVMLCAAVFQLFDALGITYSAALRGAGDTFVPAAIMIGSHWLLVIGAGWLVSELWPQWGSLGPWLAASLLFITIGVLLWWRWHCRAWMKIDVFAGSKPVKIVTDLGA